jgi:serine O-acetyltransferase
MDFEHLQQRLPAVAKAVAQSITAHEKIRHLDRVTLPRREAVVECVELLRGIAYPGYFGWQGQLDAGLEYRVGDNVHKLAERLYEQVRCALRYQRHIAEGQRGTDCDSCDDAAADAVLKFLERIPAVRELLAGDVQAILDNDPAATNSDEAIFCYPGLHAITVQRFAHELYVLHVPLIPRMMTEYAHSITGADIHAGATIGRNFFIDHATGVVIGETTVIGNNVRIHQGVTLGGLKLAGGKDAKESKEKKRHPTIEDDVRIFPSATILGGRTVIGKGTVVSANALITQSVAAHQEVKVPQPTLQILPDKLYDIYQI